MSKLAEKLKDIFYKRCLPGANIPEIDLMIEEILNLFKESLNELPLLSDEGISNVDVPTEKEIVAFIEDKKNSFGDTPIERKKIAAYTVIFSMKVAQAERDLIKQFIEKM
jgi:hypothetical protein